MTWQKGEERSFVYRVKVGLVCDFSSHVGKDGHLVHIYILGTAYKQKMQLKFFFGLQGTLLQVIPESSSFTGTLMVKPAEYHLLASVSCYSSFNMLAFCLLWADSHRNGKI